VLNAWIAPSRPLVIPTCWESLVHSFEFSKVDFQFLSRKRSGRYKDETRQHSGRKIGGETPRLHWYDWSSLSPHRLQRVGAEPLSRSKERHFLSNHSTPSCTPVNILFLIGEVYLNLCTYLNFDHCRNLQEVNSSAMT
jgi:hypothetical protein